MGRDGKKDEDEAYDPFAGLDKGSVLQVGLPPPGGLDTALSQTPPALPAACFSQPLGGLPTGDTAVR